jgi:hypothetical protein
VNKFVFVAAMTTFGLLAVPSLAPARSAAQGAERAPDRAVRVAQQTTTPSWTCRHNTYRSVECQ